MTELPKIPNSTAHPQSVWFEIHWRPKFFELREENAIIRKQERRALDAALKIIAQAAVLDESRYTLRTHIKKGCSCAKWTQHKCQSCLVLDADELLLKGER